MDPEQIRQKISEQLGIPQEHKRAGIPSAPPAPFITQPSEAPLRPEMVIRTFQSDAAQAIERRNVSVATVAIAENMKKTGTSSLSNAEPQHYLKKFIFSVLSLILIAGGGLGAYYLYKLSPLSQPTTSPQAAKTFLPSIVTPDSQRVLDVTGLNSGGVISQINQASNSIAPGTGLVTELLLATKNTQTTGEIVMQKVSGTDAFAKLGITPPDILKRSITAQWMYGVYSDTNSTAPFIILTTNFFQNAYAGMIRWEGDVADDMAKIFTYPVEMQTASTSTSSPIASYFTIKGTFHDAVIKNKDIRIFKNESGQTLLMYSFLDKNTLVITSSENAIRDIVTRIEKRAYVR